MGRISFLFISCCLIEHVRRSYRLPISYSPPFFKQQQQITVCKRARTHSKLIQYKAACVCVCVPKRVMEEIIITDRQMLPQASRIHACIAWCIQFPLFNGIESKRELLLLLLLLLQLPDIKKGPLLLSIIERKPTAISYRTATRIRSSTISFYSAYTVRTRCTFIKMREGKEQSSNYYFILDWLRCSQSSCTLLCSALLWVSYATKPFLFYYCIIIIIWQTNYQ
jgi:hypothetical protein